jgi:hypothetical protein
LGMSTICLGMLLGLPHLRMVDWGCIYIPRHNCSRWRKAAVLCGTPDSPVAHRTVWWCTGQRTVACPVRLAVALSDTLSEQVTVGVAGFPHRTVRCATGQSGGLLSGCHLELAVGCCSRVHRTIRRVGTGQSAGSTRLLSWTFLDLLNVFF